MKNSFTQSSLFRPVSSMEHSQEKNKKVSSTTLPLFRSSSSLFQCPHDCFVEENTDGEDMRSLAVIVQQQIGDRIDSLIWIILSFSESSLEISRPGFQA